MKKFSTIILSSVLLLLLIAPTAQISSAVPVFVREGDEFTFSLDEMKISEKVNGTEYADDLPYEEGSTADIVIDEVNDEDGDSTYVNYTATIDDEEIPGSSYVNEFENQLGVYFLFFFFSGFGYPNYANFDAPEDDSSDDVEDTFDIPFIVTDNGTYFQELENEYEDLDDDVSEDITYDVNVNYDSEEDTFMLDLKLQYENTTTNTAGDDASLDLLLDFDLEADVGRSIITSYSAIFESSITIGDGSRDISYRVSFSEGGGILDNLPVPNPSIGFFFALLSSMALVNVIRVKRKN